MRAAFKEGEAVEVSSEDDVRAAAGTSNGGDSDPRDSIFEELFSRRRTARQQQCGGTLPQHCHVC